MKKVEYKKLSPAQIAKLRERHVRKYFEGSHLQDYELNWLALWVRDEVRKAIRKERGLK